MNLLTNAIQAMPEGGLIQVLTRVKGEMVEIRIRDTGQGMTDEVKSRIFEPFYTTKEVGEGTGLGLSISHGIIEQHHGQIEVDSLPGHGTEVILRLPIHWPAEAQAHEATEVG
ncbi:MAG: ATP-binding protein [Bacteroidetes bacterium]|nr:MAG: ATP-binding protein [Bacteroidota bacterium]